MKPLIVFLAWFLTAAVSAAALQIPKNLGTDDRKNLLGILGYGSQTRLLSSPVPLGGHQGFEVGVSTESVPVQDLAGLGSHTGSQSEFEMVNISFAKGIANNFDVFMQCTPLPQTDNVFTYGAAVRWGVHEFQHFPGLLSVVAHASGANYLNVLDARTTGADLVMTVALDDISVYFGGGPIQAFGSFVGGTDGITAPVGGASTSVTMDTSLNDTHTVFGAAMAFDKVFLALEVDRVVQSVYGARFGVRF